jgi:hypothetical protein
LHGGTDGARARSERREGERQASRTLQTPYDPPRKYLEEGA